MRVLHVVPGMSPRHGGPINVPGLVRALTRHGVDAALLATNADPTGRLAVPLNQPVVRDGVECVFHHAWPAAGRYGLAPAMVRTLRRLVPGCDLVHIHWLYNFACLAAARAAVAAGVPFVVQPRGSLDPQMLARNRLLKRTYLDTVGRPLLRRAAAVVFTAEDERARAAYDRRCPEWVIPNGVDWSTFDELPARGRFRAAFPQLDGPFLLFLGRLSRQKGLDLLLGAFARIVRRRPDLCLVIAGPDHEGYEREVRQLAARLGLAQRVIFTGLLLDDLKLAAFVDAELFVLPSYMENFGGAIVEALACGLPVVISQGVHIHRDLSAAGAATVVSCSVDDVAAGIERALSDPDLRPRIATAGPALVQARYTWDAIVPILVSRYKDIASQRRAA